MTGIRRADVWLVHLPFAYPFVTANGVQHHRKAVLLRLEDHDGRTGWGECVADDTPYTEPETSQTAFAALAVELEQLLALRQDRTRPLLAATVDGAMADLDATVGGRALATQYGGSPGPVAVGAVVGDRAPAQAIEAASELAEQGYARIKLKVRGGDLSAIRAVRAALPSAPLAIDANGSLNPRRLTASDLDELELLFVEQPFSPGALAEHNRLRSQSSTAICLDESVRSMTDLANVVSSGAADVISIKPGLLGGVTPALEMAETARGHGLGVLVGGMLETGVGRSHALALSRSDLMTHPADLPGTANYLASDVTEPWEAIAGTITVPSTPGLGRTVDESAIAEFTVAHFGAEGGTS